MNERIKKVTVVIKEKWDGFSKAVKIVVVAVPLAVIAIIVLLAILLSHKDDVVLYSGLTTAEAGEIAAAINELGITDVRMRGDEIIVKSDQVDDLRMQLAVKGYPKTSKSYDIWNDGVDLWSTDTDKAEVARQQREANIAATLRTLNSIQYAQVELSIPKTKDYAITPTAEVPTCSVTLQLYDGEELTNGEVRAIFSMVSKSVDGLTRDNISIIDTYGRLYEWISKEQEEAEGKDASGVPVAQKRFAFQRQMQNALTADLDSFLTPIFGKNGYSVSVGAFLNFDNKTITETEYIPSPEGDNQGVLSHSQWYTQAIGDEIPAGLIGVTPNADNSPDYPTIEGLLDGESYFYSGAEHQYEVSNIITQTLADGYRIETLSVGVAVNSADMNETQREQIEEMVAMAVGTDSAHVSVYNTVFPVVSGNNGSWLGEGSQGIVTRPIDSYRNMLLFLVIALGIILVALLIVSLFMSKSRKKKIRRRQEMALAAAQAAAMDGGSWSEGEAPQEVDFNIASLTEEAGKESRETILKREIADFAQNSPDIVASILRNMLREELNG